jgi:hypothetical protein
MKETGLLAGLLPSAFERIGVFGCPFCQGDEVRGAKHDRSCPMRGNPR